MPPKTKQKATNQQLDGYLVEIYDILRLMHKDPNGVGPSYDALKRLESKILADRSDMIYKK